MSLDYPDRAVWLAKRDTPRGRTYGLMLWTKGTYSAGRTKIKNALYARRQAVKKARRKAKLLKRAELRASILSAARLRPRGTIDLLAAINDGAFL